MRKLATTAVLTWLAIGHSVSTVFAAPDTLEWGAEVNPGECDTLGPPIINVVQEVINSIDSGEAGNYWAYDDLRRSIQLWATATPGVYCAVVTYQGRFDGQAGQTSPGAGEELDGDEDGTFQGGYRATITGTLLGSPAWPAKGTLGTIDYDCDISGSCGNAVNWVDQYFSGGYGFAYDWWGWIYHGGRYGTWVNSSDGNAGDIS